MDSHPAAQGLLMGSLIPDVLIREVRCYNRKYMKPQGRITSVLSEMERNLERMNIRITSLVSNLSGKSIWRRSLTEKWMPGSRKSLSMAGYAILTRKRYANRRKVSAPRTTVSASNCSNRHMSCSKARRHAAWKRGMNLSNSTMRNR